MKYYVIKDKILGDHHTHLVVVITDFPERNKVIARFECSVQANHYKNFLQKEMDIGE